MYKLLLPNFLQLPDLIKTQIKLIIYVLLMTILFFLIVCPLVNQRVFYKKDVQSFSYVEAIILDDEIIENVPVYRFTNDSYKDNECGVSHNLAYYMELGVGDCIVIRNNNTEYKILISDILPSKITNIEDHDVDINNGYISLSDNWVMDEYTHPSVKDEFESIYKTYFFSINNFECWFFSIWLIVQVIFCFIVAKTNNKVHEQEYRIITLLGLNRTKLFTLKMLIMLLTLFLPITIGYIIAAGVYYFIFNKYIYVQFILIMYVLWILCMIAGGIYGNRKKRD